ncbi:MAG: LysR family transcriptional regulator [Paracoccaceae bacterium]
MYSLPDWTLKELAAFVLTTRLGTVTAAAESLRMSQSATSRLISSLESKLGQPLFDRVGRGLVVNAAGQAFLERASGILNAAGPEASRSPGDESRLLRIAAPPSFCAGFLQDVTARFLSENPGCSVQLEVRNTPALIEMISESRFDLGVTSGLRMHHAVRAVPLLKTRIAAVMRRDHPLSQSPLLDLARLDGQTLVQLSPRHASRVQIDTLLARRGIRPSTQVETSTGLSALHLARQMGALTLISPFPLTHSMPDDMIAVPVDMDFVYDYAAVLPVNAGRSAHLRRFMRVLQGTALQASAPFRVVPATA